MKTLQQVEPRVDLATLSGDSADAIVIGAAGSYYLSADLTGSAGKNGILINADNVSIDLNGFAVIASTGSANSFSGILDTGGHRNLSVSNGTVRGWGTGNVSLLNSSNVELRRLRLSDAVGVGSSQTGDGLHGSACSAVVIVDCLASNNAGIGFNCGDHATLSGCLASQNGNAGYFGASITGTNCTAKSNQGGWVILSDGRLHNCTSAGTKSSSPEASAFQVGDGSILTACQAIGSSHHGFDLGIGCVVTGCVAKNNAFAGFNFVSNNFLSNNLSTANGDAGYSGSGSNNRIDSNSAIANTGTGFLSSSSIADFTFRNTAFGNAPNYNPDVGTYFGPRGTPSQATSPWANF